MIRDNIRAFDDFAQKIHIYYKLWYRVQLELLALIGLWRH